jgi:maltooligosyltrehalose trehalohydrolase
VLTSALLLHRATPVAPHLLQPRHDQPRASWTPALGAYPHLDGCRFRVWAPDARCVSVVFPHMAGEWAVSRNLARGPASHFEGWVAGVPVGTRYAYRIDDEAPLWPDPASRYQPDGVHGASAYVNPHLFEWSDHGWTGISLRDLTIYELHIGTFTPEGTFAAAESRLPYLQRLGISAIELMPVAAFPGAHNWGYDGVDLFAPASTYGTPDDLRHLVDAAHRIGLGVMLDVVYTHSGADGSYLSRFTPKYFASGRASPWGESINLDGPFSEHVRSFFIENALHWIHEYHLDGLRLDATHELHDRSARHFLAELTAVVKASTSRRVLITAEHARVDKTIIRPLSDGGYGLDAIWTDDLLHHLRRAVAGDNAGYFAGFSGAVRDIAQTLRDGWFSVGQPDPVAREPRSTDTPGLPAEQFIIAMQNHDQIGNRALGRRLHHDISLGVHRALSALLLLAPETPLLFMGQEWAASTPFCYFADHAPELGEAVTAGRRAEFAAFRAFADPDTRERIPDPQALVTFERSRLDWEEQHRQPHAGMLALYQRLLALRRAHPALNQHRGDMDAIAVDDATIVLRRSSTSGHQLALVVRLRGQGAVAAPPGCEWRTLMTTEDPEFDGDNPSRPVFDAHAHAISFPVPSAILLAMPAE